MYHSKKLIFTLFASILLGYNSIGQNTEPMKIAMVSVFVEDPAKAFQYYTEVLGFEEYMYAPESYIAIVKSTLEPNGTLLLLEPTEPEGIEIAKEYKKKIYDMGLPIITFSSNNILKTAEELKLKGVKFKKDPIETSFGWEAVFDDDNGNYIQLIQLNQ